MDWYFKAMHKYAAFRGRAQRSEYWFFMLFFLLGYFITMFIDKVIGTYNAQIGIGVINGIFILVHLIPSISVSVRRLHDINKTGWWLLLKLIPLIGEIVLSIFFVIDSKEDNRYGPNPKKVLLEG